MLDPEPDSILLFVELLSLLSLTNLTVGMVLSVVLIPLLLLCSALISSSEIAFFSLSPNDLEDLKSEHSPTSKRIVTLLETPRTLLATILISNNFINIGYIIVSEYVLRKTITEDICRQWATQIAYYTPAVSWDISLLSSAISFTITTVLVTFAVVLFGEVAPKVYAKINNVRLARFMSLPLIILRNVFFPLSRILVNWTQFMEKRLAQRTTSNLASKEEIGAAIDLAVSGELNAHEEIDILKSIVHFGDVSVKQIMQPRVDVVAVDFEVSYEELLKVLKESGYSRIPVFKKELDSITGLLYVKDLLGHLDEPSHFEWQELLRTEVLYVPESKKIDDLLKEFQAKRMHMAIVVDEYGGTSGVVTLEDIMEEIIGEIKDEFDDDIELDYQKIDDYNFIFEGKTLLNDVCRIIGMDTNTFDDARGDADSIAGLILEMLGKMPRKNQEVKLNGFSFKILGITQRRIEQIKLTIDKY